MGCLQSKRETSDLHPNVFRVVNVDENGAYLCSGQLEITENDLILYREGRDSTVWPLHSLRRYGFEEGMFSFESGRRCETGEGIYAFKCRRASLLFRTLQQQIHFRNSINLNPVSRLTPSPQGRQTLQASVVHRSSIDNGQPMIMRPVSNNLPSIITDTVIPRNVTQSPRSPSSADILEVMPLYPRSQNSNNQVSNVYQLRHIKREHNNNNHSETTVDTRHFYSNDMIRDLALLRNNLQEATALNNMRDREDETLILESRYLNENVKNPKNSNVLSPTLSMSSEHYAQLSLEQQQQQHPQPEPVRLYMNITPSEANIPEASTNDVPTTPLTPKTIEYCNITIGKQEINTYANLSLGELSDSVKHAKQILSLPASSDHKQKFYELDTFPSMSTLEEVEVNYAVLDIDSNKKSLKTALEVKLPENSNSKSSSSSVVQTRGRLPSQVSDKSSTGSTTAVTPAAAIGYTTIDFDKTVALTSVAAGEEEPVGLEGCRKTRHNSCNIVTGTGSPGNNDKIK